MLYLEGVEEEVFNSLPLCTAGLIINELYSFMP